MLIRKHDILLALKKAPLTPGDFVTSPDMQKRIKDASFKTDVVGAVVLGYVPDSRTVQELYDICANVTQNRAMSPHPLELVAEENYMGALSAHFENVSFYNDDVIDSSVRQELMSFVSTHFPDEFEVDDEA